jgi:hypothetical protein
MSNVTIFTVGEEEIKWVKIENLNGSAEFMLKSTYDEQQAQQGAINGKA